MKEIGLHTSDQNTEEVVSPILQKKNMGIINTGKLILY